MNRGINLGIMQGMERGIAQGIEKEKIDIARIMMKKGLSYSMIAEITGLDESVLRGLQ